MSLENREEKPLIGIEKIISRKNRGIYKIEEKNIETYAVMIKDQK
jgi:hypothetical protein